MRKYTIFLFLLLLISCGLNARDLKIYAKKSEGGFKNTIYIRLNSLFRGFCLTLGGKRELLIDYSCPLVEAKLLMETKEMAIRYKTTPGSLMFLQGNQNNYNLFRDGSGEKPNQATIDVLNK